MRLKMKNERGSITVYVLVAMFFLIAIIAGRFILANRQLQSQIASLKQLKTVYEKNVKDYYTDTNSIDRNEIGGPDTNTIDPTPTTPGDYQTFENNIPIYNNEALKFFAEAIESDESEPYYIYQEAAFFIGGKQKQHILMSDIHVDVSSSVLLNLINNTNSDKRISELVRNNLDFNNHIIYCSDGRYVFYSSNGGGQIEASRS